MSKRRFVKVFFVAMLIFSLSALGVFAATSTTYSSYKTTGKINGHAYKYRSGLLISSSYVQARGYTTESAGKRVSAGYMGAKPSLYNSTGAVIASGSWDYNDSSCVAIDIAGPTTSRSGTFYCISNFRYYNGSGYSGTYTGYQSPKTTRSASIELPSESSLSIKTNENGETYGSGLVQLYGKDMPTLVAAVGENGICGYVYSSDLEGNLCDTLEEALEESIPANEKKIDFIPLYDKEGTQIGTFKLETIGLTEIE